MRLFLTWKCDSGLLLKARVWRLVNRRSCGGSCSRLLLLKSRCRRSVQDMNTWLCTISRLLCEMLSTRRDFARQMPSGTSVRLLCDRSSVFSSSLSNISGGRPAVTRAFRRRLSVRRHRKDCKPASEDRVRPISKIVWGWPTSFLRAFFKFHRRNSIIL